MSAWKRAADEMPEPNVNVLGVDEHGTMAMRYWGGGCEEEDWHEAPFGEHYIEPPIWWMHLPAPPGGQS